MEMYRIMYGVDTQVVNCKVYCYPILEEKSKYFVIQSGSRRKHIFKDNIGKIKNVDIDRTIFEVFVTELTNQNDYINQMVALVKESVNRKIHKYNKILDMTQFQDAKIIKVNTEI